MRDNGGLMRLGDMSNSVPAADRTVAETAYRHLRGDLIAGRFKPGARLRMNELQACYGLGLSPLREALLRLASEGFVISEGQRGFSVTPVSLGELKDLTSMRQRIEAMALTDAIANGDADWEAAIMAAYHRLAREPLPTDSRDTEATLGWELKHRAFHDALVAACGSPWLLRLRTQLADHSERYLGARLFDRRPGSAVLPPRRRAADEHGALMQAVLAHDTAKALSLMDQHIGRTAQAAGQWLQAPPAPSAPARKRVASHRPRAHATN